MTARSLRRSPTTRSPMVRVILGVFPGSPQAGFCPPTDVYETDSYVVVKVEVAGLREGDFEISLQDRRLLVRGVRHDPAAKLAYQQMEIAYGPFQTEVELPAAVEAERVEARYEDGFLVIVLRKQPPRRIAVRETR